MSTDDDPRPVWVLHLRPEKDAVPAIVRLRKALKTLLRCYGLKCLYAADLAEHEELQRKLAEGAQNCAPSEAKDV